VYAWALLSNHLQLLVRARRQPLARSMHLLLTGYAGAFNRRYRRSGHVFQNRYKSVVCDEEVYFLELVRSASESVPGAGLGGLPLAGVVGLEWACGNASIRSTSGDDLRGDTAWSPGGSLLGAALRRCQTRISLQRPLIRPRPQRAVKSMPITSRSATLGYFFIKSVASCFRVSINLEKVTVFLVRISFQVFFPAL